MTKYEWEKELKNNLKRLPQEEIARIVDYYNELFADKAESGSSEREIIRGFGNPFDVAYKIIYDSGAVAAQAEETPPSAPAQTEAKADERSVTTFRANKSPKRLAAKLLFFIPYMALTIFLWSMVIGLVSGGIGAVLWGIFTAVAGLTPMAQGTAQTLTISGMGLAALGIGIVLCISAYSVIRTAIRLTQKYYYLGKHKTA
ncbi:MAG: DUF1700 domain-containing protein [Firmicutes bacterium]|nr:DUF1700 domain-containing protein [Bacillota bacterium]